MNHEEDVPLIEFMYLVFTHMPGESYRSGLRSLLLCLCDVFRGLINSGRRSVSDSEYHEMETYVHFVAVGFFYVLIYFVRNMSRRKFSILKKSVYY